MTNKILATILTITTLTSSISYAAKNITCNGLAKTIIDDPVQPGIFYVSYVTFPSAPKISIPYPSLPVERISPAQIVTQFPNGKSLSLSISVYSRNQINFLSILHNHSILELRLPKNPDEFDLMFDDTSDREGFYKVKCVAK